MTITEARLILKTYSMPMTVEQLAVYKQALQVAMGSFTRGPL